MNLSELELPTNRKFGFFFTGVFVVIAAYFSHKDGALVAYAFVALAAVVLAITLVKADVLVPVNKLWMRFGLLLGAIVGPIILGLIFFVLFTPIAFFMRLFGRDELRLRFRDKSTHWIKRQSASQSEFFKQQF
jgi:hypothetical protein